MKIHLGVNGFQLFRSRFSCSEATPVPFLVGGGGGAVLLESLSTPVFGGNLLSSEVSFNDSGFFEIGGIEFDDVVCK